ncbi:MAG: fibronectin type III domain-containing protein, partial [Candidatus Neomarinimicrobiota bacterium]
MKNIPIILIFILSACVIEDRIWDNPYDPSSDRELWTPSDLSAVQIEDDQIELTWVRNGLDFDGFVIEKKTGEDEWQPLNILGDSTLSWIDTIDLKILVNFPHEYTYRLYAFAGEYLSNKISIKILPRVPGAPDAVNVESVNYDSAKMVIIWTASLETDFKQYLLFHGIGETGEQSLLDSIQDINRLSDTLDVNIVDPRQENWFWIGVEDTTALITIGAGKGHAPDKVPQPASLDSIVYARGEFRLKWDMSRETDFKAYLIEDVSGEDTILIQSVFSVLDTTLEIEVQEDEGHYYRIGVQDIWDQTAYSNIQAATSYQTIVAQNSLSTDGADLIIIKKMDGDLTEKVLTSFQAYFPRWIQGGRKIFAFKTGAIGLTINPNGDSLYVFDQNTSIGKPQNVGFNEDQKKIVFSTDLGGMYTLDLENDILNPLHIDSELDNNEIYGEPEFIKVNGEARILYWKTDHQANNNQGIKNIFTMTYGGDTSKIVQITDAVNFQKFTSGRLSPDGSKLLYVIE